MRQKRSRLMEATCKGKDIKQASMYAKSGQIHSNSYILLNSRTNEYFTFTKLPRFKWKRHVKEALMYENKPTKKTESL